MDPKTLTILNKLFPEAADFEPEAIADLFDLADLIDDIQQRIRDLAEETGMPALHFFLLEHLALTGGQAPLGELLRALNVPKQSATYIIDKLQDSGLVERRPDERDRRRLTVALTRKGRALMKTGFGPFYTALVSAMQGVPKRDRAVVIRSLGRFLAALPEV